MNLNLPALWPLLETLLSPLENQIVGGFVAVARLSHPDFTEEQLVSQVDGDLKHYLRSKIGLGVDVLWAIGDFKSRLDSAIASAVQATAPPTITPVASAVFPTATIAPPALTAPTALAETEPSASTEPIAASASEPAADVPAQSRAARPPTGDADVPISVPGDRSDRSDRSEGQG